MGSTTLVASLFSAISIVTMVPATAGPNLIRNGGFEEGPGDYPGVGKYWETNDAQPHPGIDVLTTDTKHSGGFSQWLKASSQWDLGAVRQVTPYGSVTAGKTYHIQAWVKTANVANPAGWYVLGVWWFHGDTYLSDSKMPRQEANNYDWRLIAWSAVAPASADRLAVLLTRHTDGNAWYDDVFVGEELPGQPVIYFTPPSFSHEIRRGRPLPSDVLTIRNSGGGTLNFAVSDGADWVSVEPSTGTSFGEMVDCTVHYAAETLSVGIHQTNITIADPAATNSPRLVPVTIKVTQPGDFNMDGDVDQEDFGVFQHCYSGSDNPQLDAACTEARLDADSDVDLDDFVIWQRCMSPPNQTPDVNCAAL